MCQCWRAFPRDQRQTHTHFHRTQAPAKTGLEWGSQPNALADHVETSRMVFYARWNASTPAEARMFREVEQHFRDQVVLRCCAILDDPKDRNALNALFDEAYVTMLISPQDKTNIYSALHLAYSKLFPDGVLIKSNNASIAAIRGHKRPRRRTTRARHNEICHRDLKEPARIFAPELEAVDACLLHSVLQCRAM